MYMAFVLNHLNGAEATESTLDDFERKELASNKLKAASNVSKAQISINNYDEIGSDEDDNVMDAYIPNCTTPKVRNEISFEKVTFFCIKLLTFCRLRNRIDHIASVHLSVV